MIKLRALENTFLPDMQGRPQYRRGAEYDFNGNLVADGEPFDMPDDFVPNLFVFEILEGYPKEVVEVDAAGRPSQVKFNPKKHTREAWAKWARAKAEAEPRGAVTGTGA